jgi:hypothetical protein
MFEGTKFEGWLNINDAGKFLGYSYTQYVRTLIKKGKLHAVKIRKGKKPMWLIDPKSLEAYKASRGTRTRSGMRRYLVRVDSTRFSEQSIINALVEAFGHPLNDAGDAVWTVEPAYKPSAKGKKADAGPVELTVIEELIPEAFKADEDVEDLFDDES